jgi:hypothetical protein
VLLTWYAPTFVFQSATERIPVRCSARGKTFLPEAVFARGPIAEGATDDGAVSTIYAYVWALVWRRGGGLELYQLFNGVWYLRNPRDPLPVLSNAARHVSLAFDQSGRAVIAWEYADQVFVRQYDGISSSYVVRGGFDGVDPLVWCDALALQQIPNSDVVLFHEGTDRKSVFSRLQRDSYAIPSSVSTFSETAFLDQLLLTGNRFYLIFKTETSEFALRSAIYPYSQTDALFAANFTIPNTGELVPLVLETQVTDNLLNVQFLIPATAVLLDLILQSSFTDTLSTANFALPQIGELKLLVLVTTLNTDTISTATFSPTTSGVLNTYINQFSAVDVLSSASFSIPPSGLLEVI